MNKHRYPIWFAEGDFNKLKFQTKTAVLATLIKELEKDGEKHKSTDLLADKIMKIIEVSWKKIRGRMEVPILPE